MGHYLYKFFTFYIITKIIKNASIISKNTHIHTHTRYITHVKNKSYNIKKIQTHTFLLHYKVIF